MPDDWFEPPDSPSPYQLESDYDEFGQLKPSRVQTVTATDDDDEPFVPVSRADLAVFATRLVAPELARARAVHATTRSQSRRRRRVPPAASRDGEPLLPKRKEKSRSVAASDKDAGVTQPGKVPVEESDEPPPLLHRQRRKNGTEVLSSDSSSGEPQNGEPPTGETKARQPSRPKHGEPPRGKLHKPLKHGESPRGELHKQPPTSTRDRPVVETVLSESDDSVEPPPLLNRTPAPIDTSDSSDDERFKGMFGPRTGYSSSSSSTSSDSDSVPPLGPKVECSSSSSSENETAPPRKSRWRSSNPFQSDSDTEHHSPDTPSKDWKKPRRYDDSTDDSEDDGPPPLAKHYLPTHEVSEDEETDDPTGAPEHISNNKAKRAAPIDYPTRRWRLRKPSKKDARKLRRFFPGANDYTIKKTLEATTQYGTRGAVDGTRLKEQIRAPNPVLKVP